MNEPVAGGTAGFSVDIRSGIDPDRVKRMWTEYEIPARLRLKQGYSEIREIPRLARENRDELRVGVPETGRYAIRARLVVEFADGTTISKTATRWINLGNAPPEGMTGRIVDPDGNGIRVYQGVTERR